MGVPFPIYYCCRLDVDSAGSGAFSETYIFYVFSHMSCHRAGTVGTLIYRYDCAALGVFQRLEHYGVRFSSSRLGTPSLFRLLLQSVYMRRLLLSQELV